MARKHSISPNQTVLWAYEALAPEWGSPALRDQVQDGQPDNTASLSSCTTTGKTEISDTDRSVSVLVCAYSRAGLGKAPRGHAGRHRAVRQRVRKTARLDHLV